MNGKSNRLPINYSVSNIVHSILSDNARARRYTTAHKIKAYRSCCSRLERFPELKSILTIRHLHHYPLKHTRLFARLAVLPPRLVIVDDRFKDLCTLPYWTSYTDQHGRTHRSFGRCPGYARLPGCPPASTPALQTQKLLDQSDLFIVLQTRLQAERSEGKWRFDMLHRLSHEIRQLLGKDSVTSVFGSGPCNACAAQRCLYGQTCQTPRLRTVSLESAGICVDRLCNDLALLTGNSSWRITWLKHFGLPQQSPKRWKYVEAIAVRLPDPI